LAKSRPIWEIDVMREAQSVSTEKEHRAAINIGNPKEETLSVDSVPVVHVAL